MPLSFPNSPTEGQIYTDTPSGNRWVWDSANTVWKSTSTFTQTITVASTAPGTPVIGQLWWNQEYGRLLVYYSDGTSSQWVDASPSDYTSGLAYGQANTVFGVANAAFGKANNALANTSGTFAGDLTVSGRLGVGAFNNTTDGVYTLGNFWAQHGGDRYLHLGSSSNYYWRIKAQYDDLLIHDASNTASVMIKYSTGSVGIGTQSPSYPLHINYSSGLGSIGLSGGAVGATTYKIMQGITGVNNGGFSLYDVTNSATRFAIDPSGRVTMPNQPGFSAYHSGNISYNVIPSPISFDTVRRNTGNHYNPSTYTFTAPVTGKYFFSAYVHFMDESTYTYQFLSFQTNGTGGTIEWMRQSDRQNYGVFGGSTIFQLTANDTVSVNYYSSGVDSGYLRGGAQFNVFEGQLIG
jgi:hypothetical protein